MDFGLKGKRALVLGASRGLAAASAMLLLEEGVEVHAVSRRGSVPDARMHAVQANLSDPASVDALIAHIEALGGVDILVNNTGGPALGPAQGQGAEKWAAAFSAMAIALFRVADAMLPGMQARGWGRIITIGSSGVEQPIANLALSNAVRGSIAGWSKTLAAEVAAQGVTVNMVLPGRIDTDRVRELDEGKARNTDSTADAVKAASLREIPAGRYGAPEEFGAAVAFLASTQAAYITGSMIRVDGGLIRSL